MNHQVFERILHSFYGLSMYGSVSLNKLHKTLCFVVIVSNTGCRVSHLFQMFTHLIMSIVNSTKLGNYLVSLTSKRCIMFITVADLIQDYPPNLNILLSGGKETN